MRVHLPNKPGALGTLASALGAIGADISLVEIVEKHGHTEVDELILDLPPLQTVESLVAACDRLSDVEVQWVRNYPRGGGIDLDVQLHRRMAAEPARASDILVGAAPLVFRAQWALLVDVEAVPRVTFATPAAPSLDAEIIRRLRPYNTLHRVVLGPGWHPGWEAHHAVVAPMSHQDEVVVVGRRGEPPFFRSELIRLAHLTGHTDTEPAVDEPSPAAEGDQHHRTPVAPPLYARPPHESPPR